MPPCLKILVSGKRAYHRKELPEIPLDENERTVAFVRLQWDINRKDAV